MSAAPGDPGTLPLRSSKLILVTLPDDGTDRHLIQALRRDKGILRANTVAVRAVAALQRAKTKGARLPEPALAKLVSVVVSETEADSVFDFIYEAANVNRPGGGMLLMQPLVGATGYALPEGIPDEAE